MLYQKDISDARLNTCHPDLRALFHEVARGFDCTIIEGHRGESRQRSLFQGGASKVDWPNSKHNAIPSLAVDAAPWHKVKKIDWDDRTGFTLFAGFVKGVAHRMGLTIRWGGDWDMDNDLSDNVFDDLVHFELIDEK